MTIHFFTFSGPRGGSSRQRAFRIADELSLRGYQTKIHTPPTRDISTTPWPKKPILIFDIISSLFSIKRDDIVFLQRTVASKYFFLIIITYLFVFRRKMIFDFDDPVYLYNPFKTKTLAKMADAVITCTYVQAEWARQFNANVHVIHIALDMAAYERRTKNYATSRMPRTIGWIGNGPEHLRNLEMLVPVLTRLAARPPAPFKFVLVGSLKNQGVYDLFGRIPGLAVEFIDELDWTDVNSTPSVIQMFDIGILPHRSDGEWNRGKTSFKILEYMACGVASVSSAFGELPRLIKNGVDGYIVDGEDAWVDALTALLTDTALCAAVGVAGQERVRSAFCFDAILPKYEAIIRLVASK